MTSSLPAIGNVQCIVIEGNDTRRFAQAQFAGDVNALTPGRWQWNAWLTAQGRVRALMHLVDPGDGTLLAVLRGGDAETLRAELEPYLMRMQATLAIRSFTGRSGRPVPLGVATKDAGDVVLGYETRSLRLCPTSNSSPDPDARNRWLLEDIRQGWPNLPAGGPEFLPPALGLERLGAVAFDKGCYPGQEIAARLHYRGGHKWFLCSLQGAGPLPKGEIRDMNGAVSAWILDTASSSTGLEALAVIPVTASRTINILGNIYTIISKFDS